MNWKNTYKFLFFIVLGVMQACYAQEAWQQALAEIDQQDYAAARTTLESMHPKGYGPWYLLGSLYEKQKEMPRALAAYRHAQKEASTFGLTQIVSALGVTSLLGNSFNIPYEYMKTVLFICWPLVFQLLFLMSWFFALYALRKRKKKSFLIFLVVLMNLVFGMLSFAQWRLLQQRSAVVMEDVSIRIGPSPSYQQREQLKAGAEVMITGESKDASWLKIKRGDVFGWIPAQTIEQV